MLDAERQERLARLSPERRAQLLSMLREQRRAAERADSIARRDSDLPPPCSFAQQRLWFADQLEPGSPVYNIPLALRIQGQLDPSLLERSLNEIVGRHEALRTTFGVHEGQPVQVIAPSLRLELPVIDLRSLPAAERESRVDRLTAEQAQTGFDLKTGPLVRARLLQVDESEQLLVLVMHHIISDGWSMEVLLRELTAIYEAFERGLPAPLQALPIQYADYAVWQRDWLQGERLQSQLDYWRQQLAGAPAVIDLPTDRPRPAVQTHNGAAHAFELPPTVGDGLEALCRSEGVTAFQALLAAFQALLQRYSGATSLSVGSPIAGRTRAEVEGLIGFFVNTLVLRTDLSDNPSFRELLGRVREATLAAYTHQDLPFEQLVEALQPERSLSHSPLFQVMFSYEPGGSEPGKIAGRPIRIQEIDTHTAKFDLLLMLNGSGPALRGEVEYNTDLFDPATISRLAGHFCTLLAGAVADPATRLSDLPLLTAGERDQLAAWNGTAVAYPVGQTLHELIEAQVERTPEAVAVVFESDSLTYAELNRRANQLAHELRARGVGLEDRVALCMERSVEVVVAILGVMKAGAAYVPIDPTNPRERIAYMLADSQARLVLTQQRVLGALGLEPGQTLCLDADLEAISQRSTANPASGALPTSPAYVIYTSGSTGRPKGVCCQHEGVVNFIAQFDRWAPLGTSDCQALWTNLSFDVSVYDIFGALLTGAAVQIVPEAIRPVSTAFFDWLAATRVTSSYIPPFMVGDLASWLGLNPGRLVLRKLLFGVEPIPERLLIEIGRRVEGVTIINAYGPTEATVACTAYSVDLAASHDRTTPIGRPIGNTQIHLLDTTLRPVPIGVPGELHIGGAGLARGYLGRPELTAEMFVPDPFSDDPNGRLYRSGDLARYLPDGNIEFLGRQDHQIKLRGFRIELGEIESALSERAEVRESLVVAREDAPGDKRLVAYLVLADGAAMPAASALRARLKERLPEYMVPSAFVPLEKLPLSPNGKLDRRALPAPPTERPEAAVGSALPASELERTIAGAWCAVLRLERVGVEDNFFDLGGHSLLVVQLQARLQELLGRNLSIVQLFQHPTVAALAAHLGRSEPDRAALQQGQERAATRLELRAQRREARPRRPGQGA